MMLLSRRYLNFWFCVVFLTSKVIASGVKEALEEHLKDIAHNEESESLKLEKGKGEKDHHLDTLTKDSHSNKYSKENDESKLLKKENESKILSEKDSYGGYNTKQDKIEDSNTDGFKRGHKKGHHKQGYQNSYHKDESSNKSTFFDDFNDEGDQSGYKSKLKSHANHGGNSYQGSHNNGQEYIKNDYRGEARNRYGDVGGKHVGHQNYGRNSYLDNSENYNKYRNDHGAYNRDKIHNRREHHYPADPPYPHNYRVPWNERGNSDYYEWERYPEWVRDYKEPGYYDHHGIIHDGGYGRGLSNGYGYRYGESRPEPIAKIPINAPIVSRRKQTITIYEDPRYSGKEQGELRTEEGDYIELDYQPSSSRYGSYDTFNNLPARGRSIGSSKINRLVYNYRRH